MANKVINIVLAGLGGQGILKASDIAAHAAFLAGHDVKKSEVHGMSQRGGSVASDIRLGSCVHSPMVPVGEADFLVMLDGDQTENNIHLLRDGGMVIEPDVFFDPDNGIEDMTDLDADDDSPVNSRNLNVALLGVLSVYLPIPEAIWLEAIRANLPERHHAANEEVFRLGAARGNDIRAGGGARD